MSRSHLMSGSKLALFLMSNFSDFFMIRLASSSCPVNEHAVANWPAGYSDFLNVSSVSALKFSSYFFKKCYVTFSPIGLPFKVVRE